MFTSMDFGTMLLKQDVSKMSKPGTMCVHAHNAGGCGHAEMHDGGISIPQMFLHTHESL